MNVKAPNYQVMTAYTNPTGSHSYVIQNNTEVLYLETSKFYYQGEVIHLGTELKHATSVVASEV